MNRIRFETQKGLTNVYSNDVLWFTAKQSAMRGSGVRNGALLSDGELAAFRHKCLYKQYMDRANQLLARRDYPSAQLMKKLGSESDIAQEVLEELMQQGLVDDWDYTLRRAEWLLTERYYSSEKTFLMLRQEGIESDLARRAIQETEANDPDALRRLIEKKYADRLAGQDGERQVTTILLRQGFHYDKIRAALRAFMEESSD